MQGVVRLDVGGKALTNHLRELLSYRCGPVTMALRNKFTILSHMDMSSETLVVEQMKAGARFPFAG